MTQQMLASLFISRVCQRDRMKDIKVKLDFDTKDFEEKSKALMAEIKGESEEIVKHSAVVFANAAAKWTPPRKNGSLSLVIPNDKYMRPYAVLSILIQGGYDGLQATEIDKIQYQNGMKFKIYNTKKNKTSRAPAYAYCRTKGELKKLRRIANRGLAKAMWGKSLSQIGVNVPIGIQRLINKSPALAGLDYSTTEMHVEDDSVYVTIENRATDIEKYAAAAEAYGYRKVAAELKHRLAALAIKERDL